MAELPDAALPVYNIKAVVGATGSSAAGALFGGADAAAGATTLRSLTRAGLEARAG